MKIRQVLRSSIAAAAVALAWPAAQAQISDGVIKIGVLSDMSSLYTDISGRGSELARGWQLKTLAPLVKA